MKERKRERGAGNIFKQPGSRFWWIRGSVNGREFRESSGSEDENVAYRLLRKRLGQKELGQPIIIERITVDGLIVMVEANYAANSRRSPDRIKQAAVHLREFFLGDYRASTIKKDKLTAYQAHRLEQKAKPATINYELALLRRGFRLAIDAEKLASCPKFAMLHVQNTRKGFFEREQFDSVLAHLIDYMKPVMEAAYITGWRTKSELLTRQWRHIDFVNGWIRLEPGEGKTGEAREFPLTPQLRDLLEHQRERVREIERATGAIIPWVFTHPLNCARAAAGSRIKDYRGAWKQACKAAGLPGHLVHDFRRTAVRNLERAGIPQSVAMKMTGHKTATVYRRYAITDETMLREAATKLAALHATEAAASTNPHRTRIVDPKKSA